MKIGDGKMLACALQILVFSWATSAQAAKPAGFRWIDKPEKGIADLMLGDQPVLRYMYGRDTSTPKRAHETYKVYHHVFGPGTQTLITKGPHGLYTHHRGMYVGWNKTKTANGSYDFWHCRKGVIQRHVKFISRTANANTAEMTAEIHWNDASGKPVIVEIRTVRVSQPRKNVWKIDWQTNLISKRGRIQLQGDRQHAGFQFRAAQKVAETKGARYIRPRGFPTQPQAYQVNDKGNPPKHINLNWLAMFFQLEGRTFTVEYLQDPNLPKPSLFSERPYGRFGAYFKTELTGEKPLVMRYRLYISTGTPPKQEEIQARYDQFVAELKQADR